MRMPCLAALAIQAALAQDTLLFDAPLGTSLEAATARGNPKPLTHDKVEIENGSARFHPGGELAYDARANLRPEGGAVRFRFRPDEPFGPRAFPILRVTLEQQPSFGDFLRLAWDGSAITASIRDRDSRLHRISSSLPAPRAGQWTEFQIRWSEPDGLRLFIAGQPAGSLPGPLLLDTRLGRISWLPQAGSIDRIRHFSTFFADSAGLRAARFGWQPAAGIPRVSVLHVRKLAIEEARASRKFWWKAVDGKRETVWPAPENESGYPDEAKSHEISPEPQPFDLIRITGNFSGQIRLDDRQTLQYTSHGDTGYVTVTSPIAVEAIELERDSGLLAEFGLFRILPRPSTSKAFSAHRATAEAGHARFAIPATPDTATEGLIAAFDAQPDAHYRIHVIDPADPARHLVEFDVIAAGPRLELGLYFPPVAARPSGLAVEIASSAAAPRTIQARLIERPVAEVRTAYAARRLLEVRDLFPIIGEHPWARESALSSLVEARREDPANETANSYWEWMHPVGNASPRPDRKAPEAQLELLSLLRQAALWWIQKRQAPSGEFGGGLAADAALIQNWPAIALLEDRKAHWRQSIRGVIDARYRAGALDGSPDSVAALAPAMLLDYGNPVIFEAMLEAARRSGNPASPASSWISWYRGNPPPADEAPDNVPDPLAHMRRFSRIYTEGELPPDQIILPTRMLQQTRLGGIAPNHAVSWEGTGSAIAANVEESSRTHLSARVINMSPAGRRVTMRVWKLDPGRYEIKTGNESRTAVLRRHDAVPIDLPPKGEVAISIRLAEALAPLSSLPDLAIAAEEIRDRFGVEVPVHNIGAVAAGPFRVTVRTAEGYLAGEQIHEGLEAPLDSVPRVRLVRFPGLKLRHGFRVSVAPMKDSAEISSDNNEARVYNLK